MNAVILAAGAGVRLKPISDQFPKPLVPVYNIPAVGLLIAKLRNLGIKKIGINVLTRNRVLARYAAACRPGITISYERRRAGTGGALRGFMPFFDGGVLVHNCDVITDFDIRKLARAHRQTGAAATLALVNRRPTNVVVTGKAGQVVGFGRRPVARGRTYAGIAVLSERLVHFFPRGGRPFSLVELFNAAIAAGERVSGVDLECSWYDIGTPRSYWRAHYDLARRAMKIRGFEFPKVMIDPTAAVETRQIRGFAAIGPAARIGPDVRLKNAIVFSRTVLDRGTYSDCIVGNGFCVRGR